MSLYEVLKASKTERFPDYWTLLWGRKLSASMIKTLTGVLPLTFTAKAGNAFDWVIEGNNDNGTENLFDYSQGCDWASGSNGASYQKIIAQQGDVFTVTSSSALYALVRGYDANDAIISGSAWSTGGTSTYTAPASIAYVKVVFRNFEYSTITAEQKATINETMLVKGSTAPDHYIPYQQGVGERTAQLFDKSNAEMKGHFYPSSNNKIAVSNGIGSITIPCEPLKTYTIKKLQSTRFQAFTTSEYPVSDSNRSDVVADNTATSLSITSRSDDHYLTVYLWSNSTDTLTYDDIINTVVVVKDSTAPQTYIPYGYQIPLIVSQQGQTDKTIDIYIGDTPLTEGETVSKTSTGVDIELFEGENVVSTTLYNKPKTEIKYR